MKRMLLAALLTISAIAATGGSSQAQCSSGNCPPQLVPYLPAAGGNHCQNHFAPFGCGGFCMGFLSKTHFHGPLFNYGPYTGYYPFEPYGPWTSDLRYNPPPLTYGHGDRGVLGWGKYAVSTLKNVFHRTNPLANRCGDKLNLGGCDTCGAATPCSGGGCSAAATSVQPAPAVAIVPNTVPFLLAAQAK